MDISHIIHCYIPYPYIISHMFPGFNPPMTQFPHRDASSAQSLPAKSNTPNWSKRYSWIFHLGVSPKIGVPLFTIGCLIDDQKFVMLNFPIARKLITYKHAELIPTVISWPVFYDPGLNRFPPSKPAMDAPNGLIWNPQVLLRYLEIIIPDFPPMARSVF